MNYYEVSEYLSRLHHLLHERLCLLAGLLEVAARLQHTHSHSTHTKLMQLKTVFVWLIWGHGFYYLLVS